MDDLKKREGEELLAYSFVVERGKIREFVQAVGDPNPVYVDKEYAVKEGYADVIAPPTFGICIDLWGGADFIKLCEANRAGDHRLLPAEPGGVQVPESD